MSNRQKMFFSIGLSFILGHRPFFILADINAGIPWHCPKWSTSLPISGTVPHMIVVLGVHVQNDDISAMFFIYSKL